MLAVHAEAAKSDAAGSASTNSKTVPLSEVIDQLSTLVAPLLDTAKIIALHAVYTKTMEGKCPPDECPTERQLSALFFLLGLGDNLMVDLGIFTTYANRLRRKLVFSGCVPTADGKLRREEIRGPPDFETWVKHFMGYCSSVVMLSSPRLRNSFRAQLIT